MWGIISYSPWMLPISLHPHGLKSCGSEVGLGAAAGWGCTPPPPAMPWEARPGERKFPAEQEVSLSFKKHLRNIYISTKFFPGKTLKMKEE